MTNPDKTIPRDLFFQIVGVLARYDGWVILTKADGMKWAGRLLAESEDATLKEELKPLISYLEEHIEKENLTIRIANQCGNKDAGNAAGERWAAYYGTLQQIPESLRGLSKS